MSTYAVIENNTVTNIIVADSKEIAEQATGKICVEYTDQNLAWIGLKYENNMFNQPEIIIPEYAENTII
jgi:hypothetical protein